MSGVDGPEEKDGKGSGVSQRVEAAYGWWRKVTLVGAMLSGLAVFGLMCFIVADVVSRNFLGGSISGSFEIAQNYFMPLAVFPAMAYVYGTGVLPKMDLLMHRFPVAAQNAVVHLLLLLELVVFAVLTYYTWIFAVDGMDRGVSFPAGGDLYTLWPLFFLVPLGFVMVLVETVFVALHNIGRERATLVVGESEAVAS